jgi:nicotinate-nucleotide adenylyltransferase
LNTCLKTGHSTTGANATLTRIGVFGGTFDPIHIGHLIIASDLQYALSLDQVLFVLAARPPHKNQREVSADHHRVAMLELALAGNDSFQVSEIELHRDGASYTADTLEALAAQHQDWDLIFLMGGDSLRDLPKWHEPDRIVRLAEIGVAARPGFDVNLETIHAAIPGSKGRIHLVETPEIAISSREIRDRIMDGKPIRYQLPYHVEEYIRGNRLYDRSTQGA